MTNYEKYKDAIIETLASSSLFALVKGEPTSCYKIDCKNCDFRSDEKHGGCPKKMREWFNAEYVERPKLTKAERAFCESLHEGCYLARDANGLLCVYNHRPNRDTDQWLLRPPFNYCKVSSSIFSVNFYFIKWEDSEPWSVEDLLKLEVQDD